MPAPSITWAAQKAVVARLKAHFASNGITWPVVDHMPQNQAMPFVAIGFVASQDVSGVTVRMTQVVIPVIGYSAYKGQKQSHEIMAEVRAALDEREADLVMDTGVCVRCWIDRQTIDLDQDGTSYAATSIVTLTIEH